MRIPSGSTDRYIVFVAVDGTDLKTREPGLSSFTVYYAVDGDTETQMTTPTTVEIDATNMPGVYWLLLDESGMTTLTGSHDTEEVVVHITHASMHPVTRSFEIYRPKFTEGQSGTMANNAVDADIERIQGDAQSATDAKDFFDAGYDPSTNKVQGVVLVDTLTTYTGNTPQTGDAFARLGAPVGASISVDIAAVKTQVAAIEVDTQDIQSRLPAALVGGLMASALNASERAAVADKLLGRTRAGGADGGRTVAQCLAINRNKWTIAADVLTVYEDDDTTPLYTAAVATTAGDPVSSVDP